MLALFLVVELIASCGRRRRYFGHLRTLFADHCVCLFGHVLNELDAVEEFTVHHGMLL